MERKVAVISIIVEDRSAAGTINGILHDYASEIIGRMGLPYAQRDISIICVALDAQEDRVCALTQALDGIPGVKAQTVISDHVA